MAEMLVHRVIHHPDMWIILHYRRDSLKLAARADRAGWIVREIEQEPSGAGRDRRRDILGPWLESGVLRTGDENRLAAEHARHQRIGAPVWRKDNYLIAFVERRHESV